MGAVNRRGFFKVLTSVLGALGLYHEPTPFRWRLTSHWPLFDERAVYPDFKIGGCADVRVWNHVLTGEEILTMYEREMDSDWELRVEGPRLQGRPSSID